MEGINPLVLVACRAPIVRSRAHVPGLLPYAQIVEKEEAQMKPSAKLYRWTRGLGAAAMVITLTMLNATNVQGQTKRPNIVMLMQDDTGWTDFGAYLGGAALGHPTPNVDRMATEFVQS
jgi:hypothetical protein